MKQTKHMTLIAALALAGACADTDEVKASSTGPSGTAATKAVRDVQAATFAIAGDRSLLKLSGTVTSAGANAFQLDTGGEMVTVEMDDWDWFHEGKQLKAGDKVVVTGRVDQDAWEKKKLEASSVYVRHLGVTFRANGADEEDLAAALMLVDTTSSALGKVKAVEGSEFTIGGENGPVRVDMSKLSVRPVVKAGDTVHAWGQFDSDPNERLELMAEGVAVLTNDKQKKM